MRYLILTFCLWAGVIHTATGQNKIEWSENKKLTINDFKGPPPNPSTGQSLILTFGQEISLDTAEIKGLSTFNAQITNYFSQDSSWIDPTDHSELRYAITQFDVNEWMARELRKRLNDNWELVIKGEYQSIVGEVVKEFDKIRLDYNNETNYGENPMGQISWETKINERLMALSAFCKTCKPQRD